MRIPVFCFLLIALAFAGCQSTPKAEKETCSYLEPTENGMRAGGVRLIEIDGKYKVWTRRVGNNPKIKLLLLHGGPATTHEYFECMESWLPQEGIEFYYYDQLGSYYSDQPADTSLWHTARFVEEVEQVRKALGLNKDNFYLLGHSWGGILALEYALKYQDNLKGLIISNMMASIPDYEKYNAVLRSKMRPGLLDTLQRFEEKEDYGNPLYVDLVMQNYYTQHLLRMPLDQWPDAINRTNKHLNPDIYVLMQGPSEFKVGGRLLKWDRKADLNKVSVPTLSIGATYDTMDPAAMEAIAKSVQRGRYHLCPQGSHWCMWDDQETYMKGLISFIKDTDSGAF